MTAIATAAVTLCDLISPRWMVYVLLFLCELSAWC